ncbi:hypothetical protein HGRIS_002721 [Hohenbuehelia grisea]|uniref:acylaminoacyl-peptidase n=1 Tax=Hohenbuehelia grisea TaxID=104357 RepID=A0ABR3JLA7_9AGAR
MFRELAELPLPVAGSFLQGSSAISTTYSIRDHDRNIKRTVTKTLFPSSQSQDDSNDASSLTWSGFSQELPKEVVASAFSPSGARRAVLRETDEKKRFVEIWRGDAIEASLDVTEKHGAFYADDYLGTLDFSPSESAILYTAEAKPPSKEASSLERFRFTPTFGEGLAGRQRPTIYLFRWREASPSIDAQEQVSVTLQAVSMAQPPPFPVLLGQAIFTGEQQIVATGYEYTAAGRLLGIKGCYNRPVGIWELSLPETQEKVEVEDPEKEREREKEEKDIGVLQCQNTKLTSLDRSCRTPRVLVQGDKRTLFWVSNATGGAHASCASLHKKDLGSNGDSVLVNTVWEPKEADAFPGLYIDGLSKRPFLKLRDTRYIVCHSTWGSRTTVLLINALNGSVEDVTPDNDGKMFSWAVLGTDGTSKVLCARSAPTIPHEVVVGEISADGSTVSSEWHIVDKPALSSKIEQSLSSLKASIIPIPGRGPTETIVYQTNDVSQKLPMITVPHGGPHATTTTAFSASTVALALEGYTLSLPNYTGSLGFGETHVRALLGNCGSLDVEDCIASVRHLIKLGISESGPENQMVQGGSHGGFLTGHLIGQYPDVFSAAVLRNPVISIGELSISDIPDWYYYEFGLPFSETTNVTPEVYKLLYDASPIRYIDAVKARVLLLIGGSDLRVAPTQGIEYFHALKGRGKEVEMLWFEKESHPLEGVESTKVGWEVARDWFATSRS